LVELLNAYVDLVDWSRQAGILSEAEAKRLGSLAGRHPARAANVLRRAVKLREAIFGIVSATASGESPTADDLAIFNRELSQAMARARLVDAADHFHFAWPNDADALDRMLPPIVHSAANLLTSGDAARVRVCSSDCCDWLFLDGTKNRSRRWCDMKVCGNRAKVQAHRKRRPVAKRTS
ncbi:MAG: hypothetical protein GY778_00920, partial [bacterium]|nr:hypothetical protein [bacterium]